MTLDQFKHAVDTLDTGLPQRPDVVDILARGRSVRRRQRGIAMAGGLAATALVAVPLGAWVAWGSGDESARVADSASASPTPTPTPLATPTEGRAAYAEQSDRMTAAVKDVFPQARRTSNDFYDSQVLVDGIIDTALGDPVTWDHVFQWNQVFAVGDLALFSVSTSWNEATPGLDWCSSQSFELESDCAVTELGGGHLLVLHDGVRIQGQAEGDWSRYAQLIAPRSDAGLVQQVDVWAKESGMTWAEAQQALPSLEDLGAIAQDERMRLPEPSSLPDTPQ